MEAMSQSPQTGQFNSYHVQDSICASKPKSLNPLKRVNSILTRISNRTIRLRRGESQSPQTGQFNSYTLDKRVKVEDLSLESQSPQTGQFNSYGWIEI